MKYHKFDHCGGVEFTPLVQISEVEAAILSCTVQPGKACAPLIGKAIQDSLVSFGWSREFPLARESKISITGAKNNVGLCIQTGNMSRLYADMMKLQQMFLAGKIKSGIIVVPDRTAAKLLGDNIANSARLMKELVIFRKVIHMPLVIFAFE